MKNYIIVLLFIVNQVFAQETYTIQGHFPKFPNSRYELKGYEGLEQKTLSQSESKEDGKFTLTYPRNYTGVAQLWMNGAYQVLLFLNHEDITLHWEDLTNRDGLETNSQEYQAFLGGMKTFQDSEAKLAGLNYLVPLYAQDSIKQHWLAHELDTVAYSFPKYIKSLPEQRFVRQYLLARGLIEQMPKTVETYKWRAPAHIAEFMAVDVKALEHSGLYKELLQGYTNLVERFPTIEETNTILNTAIDKVIGDLKDNPTLQEEVGQMWFTYLESHSLSRPAEHLATLMLKDNHSLNEKSINLFEQYRKMAVGKTAPDIELNDKKLSQVKNKYKLVVFGASWCPNCQADYPKLKEKYESLKKKYDLEMVYISIDTDKSAFENYYKDAPFITYCDTKGWNTQAAKDYYVMATPTYILLDKELKILSKIQSPEHLEAWLQANGKK
jgi:thiol-disulfide isomerase/thioredoxin